MSLDEYKSLSPLDQYYVSRYGWNLYRQKKANELAAKKAIGQIPTIGASAPKTLQTPEDFEETQPEEDPDAEVRAKKIKVLASMEERFQVEETLKQLSTVVEACPELQPLLIEYVMALFIIGKKKADRFEINVQAKANGEQIVFVRSFKFYKDGKEVIFSDFAEILGSVEE